MSLEKMDNTYFKIFTLIYLLQKPIILCWWNDQVDVDYVCDDNRISHFAGWSINIWKCYVFHVYISKVKKILLLWIWESNWSQLLGFNHRRLLNTEHEGGKANEGASEH
jgi:hypothetical protein